MEPFFGEGIGFRDLESLKLLFNIRLTCRGVGWSYFLLSTVASLSLHPVEIIEVVTNGAEWCDVRVGKRNL
jgi:hypothetical protein